MNPFKLIKILFSICLSATFLIALEYFIISDVPRVRLTFIFWFELSLLFYLAISEVSK